MALTTQRAALEPPRPAVPVPAGAPTPIRQSGPHAPTILWPSYPDPPPLVAVLAVLLAQYSADPTQRVLAKYISRWWQLDLYNRRWIRLVGLTVGPELVTLWTHDQSHLATGTEVVLADPDCLPQLERRVRQALTTRTGR